ncbi:hypothetical protein GCK32_000765 [Trichostrongylus colubriformis]|uniref:Uncharacterized protein n=1 Tax=Trichostrongylus colubriformis TaxID=6319 RepID=A0AAN8G2B8_TRICO
MFVMQAALLAICVTGICAISVKEAYLSDAQAARRRGMLNVRFRPVMHLRGTDDWEAYLSDAQAARRRGMLNVRFRPVMHLRGTDDWRKQVGMEVLHNQMMDENGVVFDVRPPTNNKVPNLFSSPTNQG